MQMAEPKARYGNFVAPYTARGRPHPYPGRSGQEQTALTASHPHAADHFAWRLRRFRVVTGWRKTLPCDAPAAWAMTKSRSPTRPELKRASLPRRRCSTGTIVRSLCAIIRKLSFSILYREFPTSNVRPVADIDESRIAVFFRSARVL